MNAGLVFLGDSRTNAGVDQISTFRKMTVFEQPGERMLVLLSAGNLALTQAVRQILCERAARTTPVSGVQRCMVDAVRIVGDAVREVHRRDAAALQEFGIEFNASFIFGGQIRGERPRLFQVYSAGNFIEATHENSYFQIGEAKYGKPIIDRVIQPSTPLDEAAKCALISMDSTLRSNISVGMPLDLLVYEADALRVTKFVHIDASNQYMAMIRNTWGSRLKQVFSEIPDPTWLDSYDVAGRTAPGNRNHSAGACTAAAVLRRAVRCADATADGQLVSRARTTAQASPIARTSRRRRSMPRREPDRPPACTGTPRVRPVARCVTNCIDGCFSSEQRPCCASSWFSPSRAARASTCFCTSGVSTQPGQIALQVTPVVAVSSATALVSPTTPCLAAT